MHLTICAVGRLRAGPERALFDDYAARFNRAGKALGLGPLTLIEVDDRKSAGPSGEAQLLRRAIPKGSVVVALDERGSPCTSPEFAGRIATWRDAGRPGVAFLIGGADGLVPELTESTDFSLSLGRMVWPHLLARVMLSEQLYRAATILAGGPYHRG